MCPGTPLDGVEYRQYQAARRAEGEGLNEQGEGRRGMGSFVLALRCLLGSKESLITARAMRSLLRMNHRLADCRISVGLLRLILQVLWSHPGDLLTFLVHLLQRRGEQRSSLVCNIDGDLDRQSHS